MLGNSLQDLYANSLKPIVWAIGRVLMVSSWWKEVRQGWTEGSQMEWSENEMIVLN